MRDDLADNRCGWTRRSCLRLVVGWFAAMGGRTLSVAQDERGDSADDDAPAVRVGLVTDVHYADKEPKGTRYYRDSLEKMRQAAERFAREKVDFAVELGDFVDAAETVEQEREFVRTIASIFNRSAPRRIFVLGNHCVQTLSKREFLEEAGQEKASFSFDQGGIHFIVLDACYRSDGVAYERGNFDWKDCFIPPAELAWLRRDLAATQSPAVVFIHQRLDTGKPYGVSNAAPVRRVLEGSGRVRLVIQGHSHHEERSEINGIVYRTVRAMVEGPGLESNGFVILECFGDGRMVLRGFGRERSEVLCRARGEKKPG